MEDTMVHRIIANLGDILSAWFVILPFVLEKVDVPIIKSLLGWEKARSKKKKQSQL